jgi:phage terminase large subunit-like protein
MLRSIARRSKVYQNSIVHQHNGLLLGAYKAISAEAGYQHGGNPHGVIFDELHTQPNRDLWDVLQTGTIKRLQPLTVAITTAGFDRNSICYEQYSHACKVRDGIIADESFLPVIYEALPDDDWTDPAIWAKANPNLGVSITASALATECKRAQENPAYENTFRRLHLNQWTESDVRWLPMAKWDAEEGDPIERRRQLLDQYKGQECWAGLDLSSTTDLTAFVLVFKNGKGFTTIPWFCVPEEGARKRGLKDRVPYPTWIRQGFIEATPGNVVDYDALRHRINELGKQFNIREIATDRWNATQLRTQLVGDGFNVTDFGQGFKSMMGPSRELEKLVMSGALTHGNNPVLRWNASNVTAKSDPAGNVKPDKQKSTDRIDGIVALIMALGQALVSTINVYQTRGLRYL